MSNTQYILHAYVLAILNDVLACAIETYQWLVWFDLAWQDINEHRNVEPPHV